MEEHPSYVRRTGKISKKESRKLTAENGKVSSWLRNMTREKEEEKSLYNTKRMEREMIWNGSQHQIQSWKLLETLE